MRGYEGSGVGEQGLGCRISSVIRVFRLCGQIYRPLLGLWYYTALSTQGIQEGTRVLTASHIRFKLSEVQSGG